MNVNLETRRSNMNTEHVPDGWTESIDEETGQPRWEEDEGNAYVRAILAADKDETYVVKACPSGDNGPIRSLGPAADIDRVRSRAIAWITGWEDEPRTSGDNLVGNGDQVVEEEAEELMRQYIRENGGPDRKDDD